MQTNDWDVESFDLASASKCVLCKFILFFWLYTLHNILWFFDAKNNNANDTSDWSDLTHGYCNRQYTIGTCTPGAMWIVWGE